MILSEDEYERIEEWKWENHYNSENEEQQTNERKEKLKNLFPDNVEDFCKKEFMQLVNNEFAQDAYARFVDDVCENKKFNLE